MKLILVRHAQTQWNKEFKLQGGNSDIELNEEGISEAKKTAIKLKDEKFEFMFSSPMARAKMTAEIINEFHDCEINFDDRLWERRFGKLEGMNYFDLEEKLIEIYEDDLYDEYELERLEVLKERVRNFWNEIFEKYFGKTILVVSHSGTLKALLSVILDEPIEVARKKYKKANASITILEFDENKLIKFKSIADDSHLQ